MMLRLRRCCQTLVGGGGLRRRTVCEVRRRTGERGAAGLDRAGLYASSSKPRPTLCPPALKFFPSIKAERVTLMPGWKRASCHLVTTYDLPSKLPPPTWPQTLGVPDTDQAGVVHFGLGGGGGRQDTVTARPRGRLSGDSHPPREMHLCPACI